MTNAELFAFLFDAPAEAEGTFAEWIRGSRRFQSFVVEYRDKIRKKLRMADTPESLQSLLLELDIARPLIEDPRCRVEYEKYAHSKERSPDLAVTFRTHTLFHLEATRLQGPHGEEEARAEKLARIVCEKLRQSVPQTLNFLVIAAADGFMTQDAANAAMKSLKRRVEQREGGLLSRAGLNDPAEFFKRFQWLNGILFRSPSETGDFPKTLLWTNPEARRPLPPEIRRLLETAFLVASTDER